MDPSAQISSSHQALVLVLNVASILCGIVGTWFMSRRFAKRLLPALLKSLLYPFVFWTPFGTRIREFLTASTKINRDVPDSDWNMLIGLMYLFWSFVFQLAVTVFE